MSEFPSAATWSPALPEPDADAPRHVTALAPAEQLLVWAFRRRLHDAAAGPACLAHGFRLAFGLAQVEAALAAFERLFELLAHHARADIVLSPLSCRRVSPDEERIMALAGALQHGRPAAAGIMAGSLVEPGSAAGLWEAMAAFVRLLTLADLGLPARSAPVATYH